MLKNKRSQKQKTKHKTQKNNSGITLIALIITIIVMLILVAVTISMAVKGGLFNYAGKAVGDMDNVLAIEKELANGKIQIGGVWYDSIDDYLKGIPSGTQSQQDIIITPSIIEEYGKKYIYLSFQIPGIASIKEYPNEYLQEGFLNFINYNVYPEKTLEMLENEAIAVLNDEQKEDYITNGALNDTFKNDIISQTSSIMYQATEREMTLPYEQSLRIYYYYFVNNGGFPETLQMMDLDMMYCYICEFPGLEPAYETTEIENQIVDLYKMFYDNTFTGDFEDVLEIMGETKDSIQTEANTEGIPYEILLKSYALILFEEGQMLLLDINGEEFLTNPVEHYYLITEDGTYTIKAELQDESGRKGETTVVVSDGEIVEDGTVEKDWVMAWVCENGVWSDPIEQGENAQGQIVAKLYETGRRITPENSTYEDYLGITFSEGPAYKLVIEGTGTMGDLTTRTE